MSRVKGGTVSRRRRKRLFNRAEGYRGKRKNVWRVARQAVDRAHEHAYKGRKQKKRDFRKLWIVRINAASRANGMSYSRFMHGLSQAVSSWTDVSLPIWLCMSRKPSPSWWRKQRLPLPLDRPRMPPC